MVQSTGSTSLHANRHLHGDRVLWRTEFDTNGKPLKVTQVLLAKSMCRAQRKAGLKVTGGIHVLRHTCCSRLAMAGYQSLSTTQRYLHLSPAAMEQVIALLDAGADLKASPDSQGLGESVETRVETKGV